MKILFRILTIFPLKIAFYLIDCLYSLLPIYLLQTLSSFQVTRKNLSIAFPALPQEEILQLSKDSYTETLKSFYETLYSWSRSPKKIIEHTRKINNRFLFSKSQNSTGLIIFAIHNRSIDFLLRWLSSQRQHTSLYKTIKFKYVNNFVKRVERRAVIKWCPQELAGSNQLLRL